MINLGDKVKDTVSGFKGIVTGRTTFLPGCVRCGITSDKLSGGKPIDTMWFDEPQLVVISANKVKEGNHTTGGPCPSIPNKVSDPK